MKTTIIALATILVTVCHALTPPPVTGNTPPAVQCPNTLCKGKVDGNHIYADPSTYKVNKNYFLQCQMGMAYCQACWPATLEYSNKCNQCLYQASDDCVTTQEWKPATTFECPDVCPTRGPDFDGNIADPSNKRQYVGCFKGITVGCVACPGVLEFNEKENACLYEGKYLTRPVKL